MSEKFYLTTPIYYVNARPHIGHAYTTIVADVLARRSRAQGIDTWFLTGTDEHGQKIERSAAAAGIPPQQFADEISARFRTLWDRMGLTYDQFIRTTDPAHKRGVQKLFSTLQENGKIYLDSYTGAYCVSDETFVDVATGTPCPDCGRPTETVTEENYFFKLSEYQLPLLKLIESNALLIEPESRRNEVLSFLRGGLKDLSISRSSFTWGIPVPGDPATAQDHVIYVWLDALANYMTAVGYGDDSSEAQARFAKYWPADLHIVGKEIIRFHCVYWPAFLLAAGLPLPKKIVAHGWLLFDDSKMSKSKGNIVRTETILDAFGALCPPSSSSRSEAEEAAVVLLTLHDRDLFAADILRYFLLREIPFGKDGSFSFRSLVERYNSDLTNAYGNLVSRVLAMLAQNENAIVPKIRDTGGERVSTLNTSLEEFASLIVRVVGEEYELHSFTKVVTVCQAFIGSVDTFINDNAPWKLAKIASIDSKTRVSEVLYTAAESIRIITALFYPILPYATASVWRQLGLGDIEQAAANGDLKDLQWGGLQPGTRLGSLSPIFPRIEKKDIPRFIQHMADMESPKPLGSLTDNADAATPTATEFPEAPIASEAAPAKKLLSRLVDETSGHTSIANPSGFDPAAAPRTSTLSEANPGAQVAASAALTTERAATPPHNDAVFATPANLPADASPQITIDDFAKIELRVAQILVAERIPKADKLLRLEVDLGYEKRQILSGIAEWYTPEELVGRRIVVITNLAPRKMRGLESHGMLLAASTEGGKPHLATFDAAADLPLGSRLK